MSRLVPVTPRPACSCSVDAAACALHGTVCQCVLECRDCSRSGYEWHVHSGEECALHPDAEVS